MAEFGWSYISCGDVLTGSGGPHGAVQFKTPGGVDGSPAFIYDTGSNRVAIGLDWPDLNGKTQPDAALHVVGDVSVTGTIFATEYQILNVTRVEEEGSTKFGTNADDDHEFTGSLKINGTLTTNGTVTLGDASDDVITSTGKLTASAGILIPDAENATDPTNTTVGLHIGTGADLNIYHNGTDSHIANSTGDLKIQSTVNSAECILIRANGGTSETIKIYSDQGTANNSITLASDAGGILFNLDATSGKKLHADVESTDADSIHLDSEGGIKLESDAHPVNITGDLVVSGSSIILGNADTDVISLVGQVTASSGILIPDADATDKVLQIGTGGDFYIAHDGTDTALSNATGKLKITSTVNAAEAIRIRTNAGTSETIKIHADQGTAVTEGAASIQLLSDSGGIGIKSGANVAHAIRITADAGTSETITIHSDQGTSATEGAASIQLLSDVGGINIKSGRNGANAILLTADGGTSETIKIHSDQGTAANSIWLKSDAGGIYFEAGATISGSAATGINLTSTQNDSDSVLIRANGGASEVIKIHSDQGTGADSIHLLSDVGGITLQVGSGDTVIVNGGNLVPSADDTIDLGAADKRWRNIYTGDLHLKNDRGNWTIVEESDYLSLRNNNTGKLYKFVMEEVLEE